MHIPQPAIDFNSTIPYNPYNNLIELEPPLLSNNYSAIINTAIQKPL
jgi:hypothetical protein